MPLFEMSANIQESETMSRKRSHDEFASEGIKVEGSQEAKSTTSAAIRASGESLLPPVSNAANHATPQGSPGLTDGGSTPARISPSPQTPVKSENAKQEDSSKSKLDSTKKQPASSTPNQPAKKKRRTAAEIEADNKEKEEKKKEREEEQAAKAAEKAAEKARIEEERAEKQAIRAVERAKAEEEKAAKAKEREEKRKKKEEEDRIKAEKKQKREAEQQRIQEEKDRKARSQMKLNSFFKLPSTPKKTETLPEKIETPRNGSPVKNTPKPSKSEYEKLFHPFFVKENTRLASLGPQMDDETRELKSQILDEHLSGKRGECRTKPFNPVELFALPEKPPKRGKLHHPVKHIMEKVYKETEKTSDPEVARKVIAEAQEKLAKVPMKIIAFSRDVRPPYYGTVTFKPFALGLSNMRQVARKPTGRLLPLEYDYDSEAEWQEEEGEDIDVDDEEEELDDEDDMEGFLDDSEDAGLGRRIFANTMEPDSTGICFEDAQGRGSSIITFEHRMEFIHEGLEHSWGIDPFSTEYWEPEIKTKTEKKTQPAATATTSKSSTKTKMAPPPTPANAFAALNAGAAGASATDPLKLVKSELMNDVKQAILNNKALSKVGIIDFIFQQFRDDVSRAEVKNTLELVAEKKGVGRQKAWALKPGHEIVS